MTGAERLALMDAINRDRRVTGQALRFAWWATGRIMAGKHVSLCAFRDEGIGHRRTAQRSASVLEHCGYLAVDRTRRVNGCHVYRFTLPEERVAA